MIRLKGRVFAGEHNANRTVAKQLPYIAETFPEVQACHSGTINIELEGSLIVARADYRTPPIKWKQNLVEGEVFDLVRVRLEVPFGGPSHEAWLYVAHRSAHRANLSKHEVIASFIELAGAQDVGVVIERQHVLLPYKHNAVHVLI